jgi:hypothetical protein
LPAASSGADDAETATGGFSLHPPSMDTDSMCRMRTTSIQRRNAQTANGTANQARDELRGGVVTRVGAIGIFFKTGAIGERNTG